MKFDRLPARLVFAQSKLALTALSLTLSHGERVRERAKHQTGKSIPQTKLTLRQLL